MLFKKIRVQYRREIFQICKNIFKVVALLFMIFSALVVIDIFSGFDFVINHLRNNALHDPADFHAAVILILTIVIIIGAWRQVVNTNKISSNDFLLRLDARYSSDELIQARAIIHKIYRNINGDNISNEFRIAETAKVIEAMRTKKDDEKMKEFIILLNFLDYLETVALFYNKGAIDRLDVSILVGESLQFYYQVFSVFIACRRINWRKPSFYSEIEKCVRSLS